MPAMEILTGFVTAPDTTLTALTMAAGNSLTIRNAPEGTPIHLIGLWNDNQTAGILQVRSPLLHDNVRGIRTVAPAGEVENLLPIGQVQNLEPQDTLVVELSGSATAGDIETACLLLWYDQVPGLEADLRMADTVLGAMLNILTVDTTITAGTAGGYSGGEAINAESDLLKANTDYAILGYNVSVECAAVRIRASGFGNLGVGGPGNETDHYDTRQWFLNLSQATGLPTVPVFNSADKGNVLIDIAQDENGTAVGVSLILAELPS